MNTRTCSILFLSLGAGLLGCGGDDTTLASSPRGTVARNAAEAFPSAPSSVPVLTRELMLSTCGRAAECAIGEPVDGTPLSREDAVGLAVLCVDGLTFSGERAIPVSGWSSRASTADVWSACVASAPGCDEVRACDVARPGVTCQEDGCLGPADWSETRCAGSVATISAKSGDVQRDCALAHATCDPKSPTGCNDRPYSACPSDHDAHDRCDGDVRLGCDGVGQVSYHDCRRLGGTCGLDARGTFDCIYPGVDDCATDAPPASTCAGGKLGLCVLKARVEVAAPALCP